MHDSALGESERDERGGERDDEDKGVCIESRAVACTSPLILVKLSTDNASVSRGRYD